MIGDELHLAAYTKVSPESDEMLKSFFPVPITEARSIAEAVRRRSPHFVGDFESDAGVSEKSRAVMRARGYRSTLYVPIVRGETDYGVITSAGSSRGPFLSIGSIYLRPSPTRR